MAGINKVILIGNLGKDPEIGYFQSGDAYCNFSIATSETWKDRDTGEKKERVEWHRIATFRRLAEVCGEYLKKGARVYIEGKLRTRSWEKDGQTHYGTEIHAYQMQMLGGNTGQRNSRNNNSGHGQNQSQEQDPFPDGGYDDDIPF